MLLIYKVRYFIYVIQNRNYIFVYHKIEFVTWFDTFILKQNDEQGGEISYFAFCYI